MASNNLGLGKGLDALIRETSGAARQADSIKTVSLKDITPNPNQPRRRFAEKPLEELASSIRNQGLLQPILVRPRGEAFPGKYEIIAGERRWRASQQAGLTEVPVVIRNLSDLDTLSAALIENLQREDLNPLEEAMGMQTLKEEFGLSQEDLAGRLGKSRSAVANCLRLLALPESFHKDLAEGRLSAGHARALLSITSERAQEYLRNLILEENLSVREAEGLAATWKQTGRFQPVSATDNTAAENAASMQNTAMAETADGSETTQDNQTAASPLPASKTSSPQSAKLMEVQAVINSLLNIPVRVTGKESKGKISISYNSREELDSIMNKLALAASDKDSQGMLAGSSHAKLRGSDSAALSHKNNAALAGQNSKALESSASHVMLAAAAGDERNPGTAEEA